MTFRSTSNNDDLRWAATENNVEGIMYHFVQDGLTQKVVEVFVLSVMFDSNKDCIKKD